MFGSRGLISRGRGSAGVLGAVLLTRVVRRHVLGKVEIWFAVTRWNWRSVLFLIIFQVRIGACQVHMRNGNTACLFTSIAHHVLQTMS